MRGGYRGGYRGRGNMGHMMGPGPRTPYMGPPMPVRPPPFDIVMYPDVFPRVNNYDDTKLTQMIVDRADKLAPTESERAQMKQTVEKCFDALKKIKEDNGAELLPGVKIEDIREVGSYKKDTMLAGHKTVDVVVVLRSMPTVESVHSLGQKVVELMREAKENSTVASRDYGCYITSSVTGVNICLLIATIPSNKGALEEDLHLSEKIMLGHLAACRHAKWFDDAAASSVKVLVRIFKDMKRRYVGLKSLSVWDFEYLCNYCVVHTVNRMPLPLGPAFRRVLQLIATGVFLPGSPGLIDVTEQPRLIGCALTFPERDQVTSTCQTLLRVLGHDAFEKVIGIDSRVDVTASISYHVEASGEQVLVTPLCSAHKEEDMKALFEYETAARELAMQGPGGPGGPPPVPMEA